MESKHILGINNLDQGQNETINSQASVRPDYLDIKYTDYEPVQMEVYQDGKKIRLQTYRFEVPQGVERKGVLFYIHGFNNYCGYRAYIFKMYAERGYECFAFDHRGQGNSEGLRGYYGSSNILYNDIYEFIYLVVHKFQIDPKKIPIFLMGTSFGSLLSFNLAIKYQNIFSGIALISPFFSSKHKTFYRIQWFAKTMHFFYPKFLLRVKNKEMQDYYNKYAYIFDDPKIIKGEGRIQSVLMFKEMQDFAYKNYYKMRTPFLLVTVKDDNIVNNERTYEIYSKIYNPLNKHIELVNTDHLRFFVEYDEVKDVVLKTVEYFDFLVDRLNEDRQITSDSRVNEKEQSLNTVKESIN